MSRWWMMLASLVVLWSTPALAQDDPPVETAEGDEVDGTGDDEVTVADEENVVDLEVEREDVSRLYAMLAVDSWFLPEGGGRGAAVLAWQRDDIWKTADLEILFNTDTLQATVRNVWVNDKVKLGGRLKGQALFGGLLQDYYREGLVDRERIFWASYINAAPHVEIQDAPNFIQFELGVRRWFFSPIEPNTSPSLTLPPDLWAFEARFRYTFWNAEHDPAFTDPHRTSWRFKGWAAGLELATDVRSDTSSWGALDEQAFDPPDRRNLTNRQPVWMRAWLRGGRETWNGGRIQGMGFLSLGQNEDDLTRVRVGGMNPYVIPVHGLPWTSHVLGNFASAHGKVMQKVFSDSEIGLAVDVVGLSDEAASRTATTRSIELEQALYGFGAVGDFRFGDWQIDARVGVAPGTSALASPLHVSAWLAVGKRLF